MHDQLAAPFAAISRELDAELTALTRNDHDHMIALQAILNAVTTRLYQHLSEDVVRLRVNSVLGLSYDAANVSLLLSVSPTPKPNRPKHRTVKEPVKHGLSVRLVMDHLMYADASHQTLRPAFTQALSATNAVSVLLNLSDPRSDLDALLREIVTDTTDTVDLILSGLSQTDAYREVLKGRAEQPLVFQEGDQTVTVTGAAGITA